MNAKWCLAPMLVVAAAWAQSPGDFRSGAAVTPAAGDALQRLTLPFEAYRDTRADLADIRVFNAKGEAMPMAFGAAPDPSREAQATTALPMFPLYGAPSSQGVSNVDVRVKTTAGGAVVSVQSTTRPAAAQRPIAWLLDASTVKTPIRQLVVDWNAGAGTEMARVTVEASDDLKTWSTVASRAPVLRVEQAGQRIEQRRVDLHGVQAKYLRVSAEPNRFALRAAEVEPDAVVRPSPRSTLAVKGAAGAKAGDFVYDLGARLPVEALRLRFGEGNSVAPFTLLARDTPDGEGRAVTSNVFYRMVREGVELESPSVEIGSRASRYWIARLDPRSPPPGGGPPTLEVQWRPAQVIFVARGDGPFTLAFGDPDAKRSLLNPSELIPGYTRHAELKLREAQVGAVTTGAKSGDWLRSITGGTSPRKIVLWAVLLVAVFALAFMAMRLSRSPAPSSARGTSPTPPD